MDTGQSLTFVQEGDNAHDCYAVAVKGRCRGTLAPQIVGHVPLELSRYIFFALHHGCGFSATVEREKPTRSPITQGGLEIICNVKVVWDNPAGLDLLKGLVNMYSVENNEQDDSAEILRNLGDLLNITMEAGMEVEQAVGGDIINDEETAPDIVVLDTDEE